MSEIKIVPENFGSMISLMENKTISGKIAKEVFQEMLKSGKSPQEIVKSKNLTQVTDETAIQEVIDSVLHENEGELQRYLSGQEKLFGFFIGQVMKKTQGKANPQLLNKLLRTMLDNLKAKN